MPPLHHSEDPRLWNPAAEFRLLGLLDAPMTRREAIRLGLLGSAGLLLGAGALGPRAFAAPIPPAPRPLAKSVIQIWLWGGPCHIDTFDPKPGAGSDYTGPLNSTADSKIAGLQLGELLPLLAGQADKYALIRNLSHNSNAHETASYLVQTGRAAGRDVFPGAGAVVSLFKGYDAGYRGLLPPYIVLTELQGRFSEAGFLGQRYKPFATGGDPAAGRFVVEGVVAPGIDDQRQHDRRELLHRLNTFGRATGGNDPRLAALAQCETEAYEMILGDAGKVFDLAQETDAERERYGRNTFGQSCLLARRLVERGVPYVTINYKGWDTHKQHFQIMRRKLPEFDRGLATLLADLAARGLLDQTVVWAGGEFGRTPRVMWEEPWNGGRGHYGKVFSALLAGGGFRGGQVVGASDAHGEEAVGPSVHPAEFIAGIYGRLGIAPDARLPHPEGLDVRAIPPLADGVRAANPLAAIL